MEKNLASKINKKNDAAKQRFLDIQDLFKRLSDSICLTVESYYIWRTLIFSRSIPEVGKERAEEIANLMSLAKNFFIPTEYSHLQLFIIGLMKFFDKDPDCLSIDSLMNKIIKNKHILTAQAFKAACPRLEEIGAIENNYVPINQEVIDHIATLNVTYNVLIKKLKDARDKQYAHTDIKVIEINFIPKEVEDFIEAIQETFNKMSGQFDQSSTTWEHLKDEAIHGTQFLLKNFERGEVQRKIERKHKYIDLESLNK